MPEGGAAAVAILQTGFGVAAKEVEKGGIEAIPLALETIAVTGIAGLAVATTPEQVDTTGSRYGIAAPDIYGPSQQADIDVRRSMKDLNESMEALPTGTEGTTLHVTDPVGARTASQTSKKNDEAISDGVPEPIVDDVTEKIERPTKVQVPKAYVPKKRDKAIRESPSPGIGSGGTSNFSPADLNRDGHVTDEEEATWIKEAE